MWSNVVCTGIVLLIVQNVQVHGSRGAAVARASNAVAGGAAAAGKQMGAVRAPPAANCTDPSPAPPTCPGDQPCSRLPAACLSCQLNCSCVYGETLTARCQPRAGVACRPDGGSGQLVTRSATCQYCWQTPHWQHECTASAHCQATATPRKHYIANCSVAADVVCLGSRRFLKRRVCDWTAGYSWSTALALSLSLGGFGADRFYLGHWQEGIGKLFSFGGLGVWTLMDVVLIAIGYLGPADGSLYV